MRSITELRDAHQGADIYVIGSGGSLNYLDPGFFDGKITVGVNNVAARWMPCTYGVTKYDEDARRVLEVPGVKVVVPRNQLGNVRLATIEIDSPDCYRFGHVMNRDERFDPARDWPTDPDHLVVSWSTITSAMHFAAYLGAANIIMVGHDCGQVGDQVNVSGYYGANEGADAQLALVTQFEPQSLKVKAQLQERYGVRVYSLNPFLNFNLDGVPFRGAHNRVNC